MCLPCAKDFYSVSKGQLCLPCMQDAICEGGKNISLNPGFWRDNLTRVNLLPCLAPEACLGGYKEDGEHPVNCAKGYSGVLC
jgi:hypothetical protein